MKRIRVPDGEGNKDMQLSGYIVRCLRRYRLLIGCIALTLVFGFETAFALGLINTLFGAILSGCALACLCLYWVNTLLGRVPVNRPCDINMAPLLNRDTVPLAASEAHDILQGQIVLVTGAAGSIGSELCRQLLDYGPERLIALDNNETGLFDLAQSLRLHKQSTCLHPYIGDITDVRSMERFFATERPQVVFHAAAYKHVPLLEQHPEQAIRTNTLATYHLCRLAQEHEVKRFVFVSTDKAAEPSSI
ncbi:MAG: SDR family NAD(P)-dependent oxidoreductase, partial [Ktedonobacteraceae bacterium]|nr:SDR family NAD(P)-dependent oxidoreductase [Ktedonobacteraceae bacterium]